MPEEVTCLVKPGIRPLAVFRVGGKSLTELARQEFISVHAVLFLHAQI